MGREGGFVYFGSIRRGKGGDFACGELVLVLCKGPEIVKPLLRDKVIRWVIYLSGLRCREVRKPCCRDVR